MTISNKINIVSLKWNQSEYFCVVDQDQTSGDSQFNMKLKLLYKFNQFCFKVVFLQNMQVF